MSDEENYNVLAKQSIMVEDFACEPGWILDFGGGGEGIIGLAKGAETVNGAPSVVIDVIVRSTVPILVSVQIKSEVSFMFTLPNNRESGDNIIDGARPNPVNGAL